ncbi:MAG: lysozyme M1 (1,4-beta-N-acetylmuramidase) [Actinobacteria bacterium]|nr:lysozyme M1 (1,4-beta-N-acetylmuramidase) [Actinomycetota bacterium]
MRNRRLTALLGALAIALSLISPVYGATTSSTFFLAQTPGYPESKLTFHGVISPKVKNAIVQIDVKLPKGWSDTKLRTRSTSSGAWMIATKVSATQASVSYRAKIYIGKKSFTTQSKSITIKQLPEVSAPEQLIDLLGPGGRIHGTDVSRWQHPGDKPIDFAKMYAAGIRFVMIKASDTRDDADALSVKYLLTDRNAAQAAGIFTGYYHYAILPNTTDRDEVIRDAKAQVQKAIWRLSSIGGYTEKDLPYALDLENNCVATSGSSCTKYAQRSLVTLWAETWLDGMFAATGRKPILYSYPTFLEQAMVRSDKLRDYPLWLAQYGINPADPGAEPGRKVFGCFVHSWTSSDCSSLWQIWQYTSCGYGDKYGVASARIDLNIFRGDSASFLKLTKGLWQPTQSDVMPSLEPTSMLITSLTATSTDKPVRITVEVRRPNNDPVVTGTVAFKLAADLTKRIDQTPVRDASGMWTLSLRNLPAGQIDGILYYVDQTNTHAGAQQPISFQLIQGPTPTPTPISSPTAIKKPVDSCANQIRN